MAEDPLLNFFLKYQHIFEKLGKQCYAIASHINALVLAQYESNNNLADFEAVATAVTLVLES
jgi:hypothetical protein